MNFSKFSKNQEYSLNWEIPRIIKSMTEYLIKKISLKIPGFGPTISFSKAKLASQAGLDEILDTRMSTIAATTIAKMIYHPAVIRVLVML